MLVTDRRSRTPDTRYLARPGGRIAYDVSGSSGPLVIMAPSLMDVRQEYRFLVPPLIEAGYRAVTVDLRGHGESSTHWSDYTAEAIGDDLLALLDELGGGPATVIGTSYAAASAVWAAAERPDVIQGIVLIGPFVRKKELGPIQRLMFQALLAGPWRVRALDAFYNSLYTTRKPDDLPSYRAALRKNLAQPGRIEAIRAMLATDTQVVKRMPTMTTPTLIVMGSKDPDFKNPYEEATWIADKLRGEVIMIDGAGHYPHAEMPDVTSRAIIAFFKAGEHYHA
jgi:pimeloyl-ACP methyl ester carboxylesterase